MKTCKDCKLEKPLSDFERRFTHTWYTMRRCRCCEATRLLSYRKANRKKLALKIKKYRIENPEKHLISNRKYKAQNTDKFKIIQRSSDLKRRIKTPVKLKSRQKTLTLIKNGTIERLPCLLCGSPKSQVHHLDYNDPFKIEWLCYSHHRAWHRVFLAEEAR